MMNCRKKFSTSFGRKSWSLILSEKIPFSARRIEQLRQLLRNNPAAYCWAQSLNSGIQVKYPTERFRSYHKFVPVLPLYFRSLIKAWHIRNQFNSVKTYCMFLGNQRSGHTIIASLLDAHPNMMISHELNALKYWVMGFTKKQIYSLIAENAKAFGQKGRGESGYNYVVPNQYQGHHKELLVIGDKDGQHDTFLLTRFPNAMDNLLKKNHDTKILIVVRNPYDNITTICTRNRKTAIDKKEIDLYFDMAAAVGRFVQSADRSEYWYIHYDDFVANPKQSLTEMCQFLGVDAPADYLDDCASIIYKSPSRTRSKLPWSEDLIAYSQTRINSIPYLSRYSYLDKVVASAS